MSANDPHHDDPDSEPELLDEDDADEVIDEEGDVAMDSDEEAGAGDDDREEIQLVNDSIAYFDLHKDSIFAIAQHPTRPNLVATGGSEGDADDAPGKGYVIDTAAAVPRPVLPASYASDPSSAAAQSTELKAIFTIDGHTDSINTLAFTLPKGDALVSGGLDGRLRVYASKGDSYAFLAESQETEEINWLAPCPAPEYPNAIALGASDGSVWVYNIDPTDAAEPLQIVQSYFLHTGPSTAGTWTPDGQLLASVSEDSSLHVFDVWGAAAAKSLVTDNGQTVVSLTEADQRFVVEGGLYSVAVAPSGAFLAVGGAGGAIRVVGLPRLSAAPQQQQQPRGGRQARGTAEPSAQAGAILAALNVQSDSVESLSFSPAPQTLLAAGSVDGSIAIFDTARSFAVRRHIREAHEAFPVVKVDFVRSAGGQSAGWLLTSCGMDGVVRRWDLRGATASQHVPNAAVAGLSKEWRGHRGDGEGGGVLGFVQGETGERVITAGDDGVALVFEA
ncbi:WD40 repeat-like protein [Thozetella sp. PMI_491]|nr:WD40 repeat-like protein [Thozetella sp. PMI_491]